MTDLAGDYKLKSWLMMGHERHAPGTVMRLSHADAKAALEHGTAERCDADPEAQASAEAEPADASEPTVPGDAPPMTKAQRKAAAKAAREALESPDPASKPADPEAQASAEAD